MKKSVVALLAAGLFFIALYLALQPPPSNYTMNTTSLAATTTPVEKTTTPQTNARQTTTTSEKPPATQTTATPAAQPPRVVYVPAIEVEIEAPTAVNTTKLPIYLNYTIVVRNRGNGTGVVLLGDETYVIAPGQEVRKAANKTVWWAGEHSVDAVVNGTRYAKAVGVYYYTPRLQAEPVYINATKLPANFTVTVRVSNLGNLTAWVGGVAVAPGETRAINTTILVEAAGTYVVDDLGGGGRHLRRGDARRGGAGYCALLRGGLRLEGGRPL